MSSAPWTPGGKPRDTIQVKLLLDLAGYLTMYGAPLYRVERRLRVAADLFQVPLSGFYLPSNIMINVGDGSSTHPSRTTFLDIPSAMNMTKLQKIDTMCADLLGIMTRKHQELIERVNPDASSVSLTPSVMAQDYRIYEVMTEKLAKIANEPDPYSIVISTIASACQSIFIVTLFYKGSFADIIAAAIFGALTNIIQLVADNHSNGHHTPIFIAFSTSFLCRLIQSPVIWSWITTRGVCHDAVTIASLALYMAGFQFTVAILEVSAGQPVAGAVRLFMAFMRSFQIGYGISLGSKLAIYILTLANTWNADIAAASCPNAAELAIVDFWRLLVFFPMSIAIAIGLKAHHNQWPKMFVPVAASFIVANLTQPYFSTELSLVTTSFCLGLTANLVARMYNQIAVASVFAGLVWLLPGGLGLRGAVAMISNDGGTNFGIQIILRTLSISIGLYLSNVVLFPMSFGSKKSGEDDLMTA